MQGADQHRHAAPVRGTGVPALHVADRARTDPGGFGELLHGQAGGLAQSPQLGAEGLLNRPGTRCFRRRRRGLFLRVKAHGPLLWDGS